MLGKLIKGTKATPLRLLDRSTCVWTLQASFFGNNTCWYVRKTRPPLKRKRAWCTTLHVTAVESTALERHLGVWGRDWANTRENKQHPQSGNTMFTASHEIDWERIKILDQKTLDIKRKIKEVIHNRRQRPTLNRDGDYGLPATLNHLLSRD